MVLATFCAPIQLQIFLVWTHTIFEQCLRYRKGNLLLILVFKTGQNDSMMLNLVILLVREDSQIHPHAFQTMTEQFQLRE
jgi:hypothetical protein